jgi:Tachylectin
VIEILALFPPLCTRTTECSWAEVTCPGYLAPNPFRRDHPGGRKGTKQVRVGHQDLPKSAHIQKVLGDRIQEQLAAFSPSNPQPTPVPQIASSDLLWYQHQGLSNGSTEWASGTGTKVGNGWNYKTVFASSNGVIYGITANNELCWYRHDGWQDGSSRWANGNCITVGRGWNFKTVFASAGGVIYGIKENGQLYWYRHDGWRDGSSRWANGSGTNVGSGWNFKTVFASSNGVNSVIYGIKENNDLYWYRHDGWQDGSNNWANGGTGIVVGHGWNFRSVFASSNGIVYGIAQ